MMTLRSNRSIFSALTGLILLPVALVAADKIDFVRQVQPIFAQHCLECHGPQKQESGLRLDHKPTVMQGGNHGPALLPGRSAESLLLKVVRGEHDEIAAMPKKGEKLSSSQVSVLRQWIDEGAAWPEAASAKVTSSRDHWAFKAPQRPPLPRLKNQKWVRNPIDAFVMARLEKEKLSPAPQADRYTLIRRLSLDLTGLPPSPAEVAGFVNDRSSDAYQKVVERLLASPHYGERWGKHWLDAARYADSNGFEKDAARSIWPYRDYVIQALNRDLPFDQFTIEQLGGDLLPGATLDQKVATGFLRNSMMNQEGGIEPEQFRVEAMIDRMDAVGRTWLGLSIACAQCHNHKYDPISAREYYQLYSFLNNDDEPAIEVPTAEQQTRREQIITKARELEEKARTPDGLERFKVWVDQLRTNQVKWTPLEPVEWHNFATKYEKQPDHSLLGGGDIKPGAVTHVWIDTPLTNLTGFQIEALLDPNLPYGGPGLVARGGYLLKELTCEAYAMTNATVTNKINFSRAAASLEAPGFPASSTIDGNTDKGGWSAAIVPVLKNSEHRIVFTCAEPIAGFPGGTRLKFTLYQKHSNGDGHSGAVDSDSKMDSHTFGRFRISATSQPGPLPADPLTLAQRRLLEVAGTNQAEIAPELYAVFRRVDTNFVSLNREIENSFTNWPYAATTLALQERAQPRETRIFRRGDWKKQGELVSPGVPEILHSFPSGAPTNRLGFARWVVDRRSPTTSRVMVNRIWQAYFGQGIFTTAEDIGTRVDPPSHPELLDWLAVELMEPSVSPFKGAAMPGEDAPALPWQKSSATPWSLKHLHRLIVDSATYRQSARVTPGLLEKDSYNRLLARGPRFRMEAEVVQDIALKAAGLLNPKIGGPSVKPPIPGNVADQVFGGFSWNETSGEDRYRRGMYTFWKRALPFPSLLAFDAPVAETSCTRRPRSNTPLQALTTLNERTFVEAAQAMGLKVYQEGGADERSRLQFAFGLATGRPPSPGETEKVLRFWEEQYRYFEDRTVDALKVGAVSTTNPPTNVNLHKVAAWAMTCRALLNLDETITKE